MEKTEYNTCHNQGDHGVKNITSSVYSFEKLRNEGYLYVDKTEFIWNLINPAGESYFLSRPRRFGKSLTISTLKAVFEGKKELFKGLAIYDKPYDWKPYPVIHLDMANCDIHTPEELSEYLDSLLMNIASSFGMKLRGELLTNRFENLVIDIAKLGSPVILLDEYDKPILNNITNPVSKEILQRLRRFCLTVRHIQMNHRIWFPVVWFIINRQPFEQIFFAFENGFRYHVSHLDSKAA